MTRCTMQVPVARSHEADRYAFLHELWERTALSALALAVCQTLWRRAGRASRAVKLYHGAGADATEVHESFMFALVHGMRVDCHLEESQLRLRELGCCARLNLPSTRRSR